MKVNKFSLKKKWFLIPLALLTPEVLAEVIDINYFMSTNLFTQEPRIGLQAKACHSKADPMEIRVRFGEMFSPLVDDGSGVKLTIEGADYRKSYSVFSAREVNSKNASTDTEFLVPWRVSVNGKVNGSVSVNKVVPGSEAIYKHAFCFADGYFGNSGGRIPYSSPSTHGYFPLFEDYVPQQLLNTSTSDSIILNKKAFQQLCGNRVPTHDIEHVWSGSLPYNDPKIPSAIDSAMKREGAVAFLTKGLFYLDYTPGVDETTVLAHESLAQPPAINSLPLDNNGNAAYFFPITSPHGGVYLENGDFSLTLNNRNISKITLTIGYTVWSWESSDKDVSGNNLYLYKKNVDPIFPGTANLNISQEKDPFREPDSALPDNFYNNGYLTANYFRGTLVSEANLSQDYKNYIKNIMPLSLPAVTDGNINLVNTDSLTFTIGQIHTESSLGNYALRVSGQPLKFAPLYINNKETVSAMKMRDLCY